MTLAPSVAPGEIRAEVSLTEASSTRPGQRPPDQQTAQLLASNGARIFV